MSDFRLSSKFTPKGDQPHAISMLVDGITSNQRYQTLHGVTGSGKTYTIANVIAKTGRPALILSHNKTLAAQLCSEFKEFFPNNAVEYFVSYYDYYRPEAYLPARDIFIEKETQVNDDIDKLRHSATMSLLERRDCIIVASVSCIYGLGDPDDYKNLVISLRPGQFITRDKLLSKLVEIQYERNDINFVRGKFRVRGDVVEIFPASESSRATRIEFFGDEIERISDVDVLTGEILGKRSHVAIFPASHYVTTPEKMQCAIKSIRQELDSQCELFKKEDKILEMQRLIQRTNYDLEMMQEVGFCQGIENYSRHISGRVPGSSPFTLMDYFPDDYLLVIDESHVTVGQVRSMYKGDRSRKESLVNHGFRLPSAFDNRPLCFEEFEARINQCVYVSATPNVYEREKSTQIVEQIIRPTGLLDPKIFVRPIAGQIDDLIGEIKIRTEKKERVLVTTLTRKMAEDLTDYLTESGIKVKYLHYEVDTLERMAIVRDLRLGTFDVLVGINLLREGLDLPEVSLVAILDADKEGFLRSETSLIQTIGRAARNVDGTVIMYADVETHSMAAAIAETERRRRLQHEYNIQNNITPKSILKGVHQVIDTFTPVDKAPATEENKQVLIVKYTLEMKAAAENLRFEDAARLRDMIRDLEREIGI